MSNPNHLRQFYHIFCRYMSGFKGRVKTDISRWCATKYATIPDVGCLNLAYYQPMVAYLVACHQDMSVFPVKIKS